MPQSLAQVLVHIIFSTKDREPFLNAPEYRKEMHRMLGGISNKLKCQSIIVGGVSDHVHILAAQSRTICVADRIKELKRQSSLWAKHGATGFHWQAGYGAFSVSRSHKRAVIRYIQDQEEHHRKTSFQDEFRKFLTKYEIEFDERYVWD